LRTSSTGSFILGQKGVGDQQVVYHQGQQDGAASSVVVDDFPHLVRNGCDLAGRILPSQFARPLRHRVKIGFRFLQAEGAKFPHLRSQRLKVLFQARGLRAPGDEDDGVPEAGEDVQKPFQRLRPFRLQAQAALNLVLPVEEPFGGI
jgi:hypothetical protein